MLFDYFEPKTLKDALAELSINRDGAMLLAGGTDLIPKIKNSTINPTQIINIGNLHELQYIHYNHPEGLSFGAAVTLREIEKDINIRKFYPALYEGAHSMASTQIRNTGTVVGNICNAVPSADTAPALLVYDAQILVESSEGSRTIKIDDFFKGVCKTNLNANEVVTGIKLPPQLADSKANYIKYTVRRALDLALVGVAVNFSCQNGICNNVKIALGAVATTPCRAYNAEKYLLGKKITLELMEEAAEIASVKDCSPISDKRAGAEYRREMVKICTRDALIKTSNLEGGSN